MSARESARGTTPRLTVVAVLRVAIGFLGWWGIVLVGVLAAAFTVWSVPFTLDLFSPGRSGTASTGSVGEDVFVGGGVIGYGILAATGALRKLGPAQSRRGVPLAYGRDAAVAAVASGSLLTVAGIGGDFLRTVVPASWFRGNPAASWAHLSSGELIVNGLRAGGEEEVGMVFVPFVLLALVLWLWRDGFKRPLTPGIVWAGVIGTSLVCVAVRFNLHTYQGLAPALLAVVWSAGQVTLFLWSRSILALVLGHAFYDAAIAGGVIPTEDVSAFWIAVAVLAVAAVLAVRRLRGDGVGFTIEAGTPRPLEVTTR